MVWVTRPVFGSRLKLTTGFTTIAVEAWPDERAQGFVWPAMIRHEVTTITVTPNDALITAASAGAVPARPATRAAAQSHLLRLFTRTSPACAPSANTQASTVGHA
jgi:hypothetical protein